MLSYRIGLPGWTLAARVGIPLSLRVYAMKDEEAGVFVGSSPDLHGLTVEAPTLEELHIEVTGATSKLLELEFHKPVQRAKTEIRLSDAVFCAA